MTLFGVVKMSCGVKNKVQGGIYQYLKRHIIRAGYPTYQERIMEEIGSRWTLKILFTLNEQCRY